MSEEESRRCNCMFCGEQLVLSSESEAVLHMQTCPALQEQLQSPAQFTLPSSVRAEMERSQREQQAKEQQAKEMEVSHRLSMCGNGGCGLEGTMQCSACGTRYCGRECQRSDWKVHKQMCKLLAAQANNKNI
jgi:hypothetical protein